MTKGDSRFSAWQEANQIRREQIIDGYLEYLATTSIRVKNTTDLAEFVAKHISQSEGKSCNKSTLMRNPRYKAKLLSFQATHLSPGIKAIAVAAVKDPVAQVLVITSNLEAANVKRELDRLKIYVESLEEQLDRLQSQKGKVDTLRLADAGVQSGAAGLGEMEFRFIRTCQALRMLLDNLKTIVELDVTDQCIRDRSKRRDNVMIPKELASPFFDWLAGMPSGGK